MPTTNELCDKLTDEFISYLFVCFNTLPQKEVIDFAHKR